MKVLVEGYMAPYTLSLSVYGFLSCICLADLIRRLSNSKMKHRLSNNYAPDESESMDS